MLLSNKLILVNMTSDNIEQHCVKKYYPEVSLKFRLDTIKVLVIFGCEDKEDFQIGRAHV